MAEDSGEWVGGQPTLALVWPSPADRLFRGSVRRTVQLRCGISHRNFAASMFIHWVQLEYRSNFFTLTWKSCSLARQEITLFLELKPQLPPSSANINFKSLSPSTPTFLKFPFKFAYKTLYACLILHARYLQPTSSSWIYSSQQTSSRVHFYTLPPASST